MLEGVVVFLSEETRSGFLEGDDGFEYFFFEVDLPKGIHLQKGDAVSFAVVSDPVGQKAVQVQKL